MRGGVKEEKSAARRLRLQHATPPGKGESSVGARESWPVARDSSLVAHDSGAENKKSESRNSKQIRMFGRQKTEGWIPTPRLRGDRLCRNDKHPVSSRRLLRQCASTARSVPQPDRRSMASSQLKGAWVKVVVCLAVNRV